MPMALVLGGQTIRLTHDKSLVALRLAELGVDLGFDCTGVFKAEAKVALCFAVGVRKAAVRAPVKDGGVTDLVQGVNHKLCDGSQRRITAASCTPNCLAPVVKVTHEALGIRHGSITMIHDVTNTQTIVGRHPKTCAARGRRC